MSFKDLYGNTVRDGRRKTDGRKSFDLQQLWQGNHEILNLKLLGYSNRQIAEAQGCTEATVSNTVNSSIGKEKLNAMRAARDEGTLDVMKEVEERVPEALNVYDEIIVSDKASLALKKRVADTILLDICGHRAPKRIEGKLAHGHLVDPELLKILKENGRKSAEACGDLVKE
jgi:DNA-binding CsgD family transcriptional regulator